MKDTELVGSLREALENVEKASQALEKGDETALDLSLWKAFSKIEYASFLVSIETGDNERLQVRRRRVNKIDMTSSLNDAKDLLFQALNLLEKDTPSAKVADDIEKAKTSVFDSMRKQSAKARKKKARTAASTAPSSASSQ